MNKRTALEAIQRTKKDHPYDGTITEVAETFVHVRLAGGQRKVIHNVIIADHILARKQVLYRGLKCKVSKLYERENSGRYILTDVLPNVSYGDYAGAGTGIPDTPRISVSANCDSGEWTITWSAINPVTYYELYWSTDANGTAAQLITETILRTADVTFDTTSPPRIYFAVRAISGTHEGELSPWTTDLTFFTQVRMVPFGDSQNHGMITSTGIWWQVFNGMARWSDDHGASWTVVTPDSGLNYIQVLGDNDAIWLLANNVATGAGIIYKTTTQGQSWESVEIEPDADVVSLIWAIADPGLRFTYWSSDNGICFSLIDPDNIEEFIYDQVPLSPAATAGSLADRSHYAFPVTVDDNIDLWFFAGRMTNPGDLSGVHHLILWNELESEWSSIESSLGALHIAGCWIGPDPGSGSRPIKALVLEGIE